jgi:hypothetical protein
MNPKNIRYFLIISVITDIVLIAYLSTLTAEIGFFFFFFLAALLLGGTFLFYIFYKKNK